MAAPAPPPVKAMPSSSSVGCFFTLEEVAFKTIRTS